MSVDFVMKHCARQAVDNLSLTLNTLCYERMMRKAAAWNDEMLNEKIGWEEIFYRALGTAFGFGRNGKGMGELSRRVAPGCIRKHRDQTGMIEAMLFGQSGRLDEVEDNDPYVGRLKADYRLLKAKFGWEDLPPIGWHMGRFGKGMGADVRIAQWAALLHKTDSDLFSYMTENLAYEDMTRKLGEITASGYWDTHDTLGGEKTAARPKRPGKKAVEGLMINGIVPMVVGYAEARGDDGLKRKAFKLLTDIPPEDNNIIRAWNREAARPCAHAAHTQGVLELYKNYCPEERCENCPFGQKTRSVQ